MPLSWLIFLAGWLCVPTVQKGHMHVKVVSPEGTEVELTERVRDALSRPKHFAVLKDAWQRCAPLDGMAYDQLLEALMPRRMPCEASAVEVTRPASISFLQMKMSRKGYMKKIVELQKIIETMTWPGQINRTSIVVAHVLCSWVHACLHQALRHHSQKVHLVLRHHLP